MNTKRTRINPLDLLRMMQEGLPSEKIGKALGCSEALVRDIAKENGFRWKQGPSKTDIILEMIEAGKRPKEIAEAVGCSEKFVYSVSYKKGKHFGTLTCISEKDIIEAINEGLNNYEIADRFGCDPRTVRDTINRHKIERTDAQKKAIRERAIDKERLTPEKIQSKINESNTDLEYVGGYINNKEDITVRCRKCGTVFDVNYQSVNGRSLRNACPECRREQEEQKEAERREQEQEQAERKRAQEEERAARRAIRERLQEEKRLAAWHPCPVCGEQTNRPVYCSNRCANKAENHRREVKRRHKIAEAMVDKDITVEGLYKRDGGRCYYCGKECRLDDFTVRDGAFIAGDWYPSVDHVKPLAKGGKHAWTNVVLAHRRCNSLKSDKEPEQMTLW